MGRGVRQATSLTTTTASEALAQRTEESKESIAFKKELQTLLALKYFFSIKRSENSFIIECNAEYVLGAPRKMEEILDKLVLTFKSALASKNLKEGDHYETKKRSIKAKKWGAHCYGKIYLVGGSFR